MAFHKRLPWLFTLVSQLWPVVPELLRLWFRSNIIFIKRGLDFAPEGRLGSFGNRFGIHVAFHGQVLVFFCTVSRLWPVVPELLRFWFRNDMIFGFAHKKGLAFALQGRLGSFWDPSGIHVAFQEHFLWFVLLVLPLWRFVPDLPRFAKKCFINYIIFNKKCIYTAL